MDGAVVTVADELEALADLLEAESQDHTARNAIIAGALLGRLKRKGSKQTSTPGVAGTSAAATGATVNGAGIPGRAVAAASKASSQRQLTVAAFQNVSPRGKPINPIPIMPGDNLYLGRTQEPGAGLLTRNPAGRLYATALDTLAAGKIAEIATSLYEKRWNAEPDCCDICQQNEDAGWIPADEDFPSGDEEPDAHPNCRCELEARRAVEE